MSLPNWFSVSDIRIDCDCIVFNVVVLNGYWSNFEAIPDDLVESWIKCESGMIIFDSPFNWFSLIYFWISSDVQTLTPGVSLRNSKVKSIQYNGWKQHHGLEDGMCIKEDNIIGNKKTTKMENQSKIDHTFIKETLTSAARIKRKPR